MLLSQEVSFIVQCPEIVELREILKYDVYFRNESPQMIKLPIFILGGSDRIFYHKLYDSAGLEIKIQFIPEYGLSALALSDRKVELPPGGLLGSFDKLQADKIFPGPGRYRLQFVWEGLINSGKNKKQNRFVVDRWILVK